MRCFAALLLISSLGWLQAPGKESAIDSAGKARTLQFDAVIELKDATSVSPTVLFLRYWVAIDSYHLAVIWSEPQGRESKFPIVPTTLSISSNPGSFSSAHILIPQVNTNFSKPLVDRPAFAYRFGYYPVFDTRFAEKEADEERVYLKDIEASMSRQTNVVTNFTGELCILRNDLKLITSFQDGLLMSLEMKDRDNKRLKSILYDYDFRQLSREKVILPERKLTATLRNNGATVVLNGHTNYVKEFPVGYRKGGQIATVEFAPMTFGGKTTPLPFRIAVRGSTNQLLRSCYITNFQQVNLDSDQAAKAALQFSEGGTRYGRFRELMKKCAKSSDGVLSVEDAKDIQDLATSFAKTSREGVNVGEKLKSLNSLVQLGQLQNDQQQLQHNFRTYLTTLRANGYLSSAFTSGLSLIEKDVMRGRYLQAKSLLEIWSESISDADFELLLSLGLHELNKGNFVIIPQLLSVLLKRTDVSTNLLFEAAAMRSIALDKIKTLLSQSAPITYAKAQSEFAAHLITTDHLSKEITKNLEVAQHLLKGVESLSASQIGIKTQLEVVIFKEKQPH